MNVLIQVSGEFFDNTFGVISNDGIIERFAMYYEDKVIDFKTPGIYIRIQGQSKSGPSGNTI